MRHRSIDWDSPKIPLVQEQDCPCRFGIKSRRLSAILMALLKIRFCPLEKTFGIPLVPGHEGTPIGLIGLVVNNSTNLG
jgi:hypothetical protein